MGPTQAFIYHANFKHNLQLIQKAVSPARIMAVVKADAYGHGAVELAQSALQAGASYLGVAFHEEGIELREAGITAPILVFGAQLPQFFEAHLKYNLDLTLSYAGQIEPLRQTAQRLNIKPRVHIKIDTGMGRVGFLADGDLTPVFDLLQADWLTVAGVYSHLSSADEDDLTYTYGQIERFKAVRSTILEHTDRPPLFHLANSAAIMRLPEAYFDMVRPGVMLYGNPPGPDFPLTWELKEVMRFVSRVTAIKELPAGHPVSYNRRYHTSTTEKVAVVPAGYADGYNRQMTNKGPVLIRGKLYPIAGTVCMDQFLVRLGQDDSVQVGDEVVLFGPQEQEHISITEVSRTLHTIPYEVTCWVSRRVPRIHIKE